MAVAGSGLTSLPGRSSSLGKDSDPAVIFLWLPGGPPHQDTYDMKPGAPIEYRGAFNPIRTNVPVLISANSFLCRRNGRTDSV